MDGCTVLIISSVVLTQETSPPNMTVSAACSGVLNGRRAAHVHSFPEGIDPGQDVLTIQATLTWWNGRFFVFQRHCGHYNLALA
jgi:hypothetical protein